MTGEDGQSRQAGGGYRNFETALDRALEAKRRLLNKSRLAGA
jgi:hypothetical protein